MLRSGGIFSFFYLLSEGKSGGIILAAMVLIILVIQVTAPGQTTTGESSRVKFIGLAGIGLGCLYALHALGLASHSGYGFWQRLTVHDVEDIADAELVRGGGSLGGLGFGILQLWDTLQGYERLSVVVKHAVVYLVPTVVLHGFLKKQIGQGIRGGNDPQKEVQR